MSLALSTHQHTIKKTVSCCGVGLHSGRNVHLNIKPANINSGIRFFRTDLPGAGFLPAHMSNVVDTRLATTIGNKYFTVSTTEHLLAACQAFGIDNVDIELSSDEVPIMDGSAQPFLSLLRSVGRKKQNATRQAIRITRPISYSKGEKSIRIRPYDGMKISGEIRFDDEIIQKQQFSFDIEEDDFDNQLASARTFGYVEEVEELWANGLALGGTLANVIAIHWNRKSVLNEDGLRFTDEFIRHKMLDLIGDISLLGFPVLGHIEFHRAGHTEHLALMQAITSSPTCWELTTLQKKGWFHTEKATPKVSLSPQEPDDRLTAGSAI